MRWARLEHHHAPSGNATHLAQRRHLHVDWHVVQSERSSHDVERIVRERQGGRVRRRPSESWTLVPFRGESYPIVNVVHADDHSASAGEGRRLIAAAGGYVEHPIGLGDLGQLDQERPDVAVGVAIELDVGGAIPRVEAG